MNLTGKVALVTGGAVRVGPGDRIGLGSRRSRYNAASYHSSAAKVPRPPLPESRQLVVTRVAQAADVFLPMGSSRRI